MIKEFVSAWDKNKGTLEEYFRTHNQEEYDTYNKLVELLFDIVINPTITEKREMYDTGNITVIDNGDWQETYIFVLHKLCYTPCVTDYVYTNVEYGSCSGCDTLQSIHQYNHYLPNESQIKDYMTLCLHLLQRCTYMVNGEEEK